MSVAIADIRQIVTEAGQLALGYYGKVTGSVKADQSVVSDADGAVEDFLRSSLTALAPGYGYIGEETAESRPAAAGETRAWVVDALDGSRAFVAGMPLWMPAVCLMDGDRPIAGAAVNPVTNELFWADVDGAGLLQRRAAPPEAVHDPGAEHVHLRADEPPAHLRGRLPGPHLLPGCADLPAVPAREGRGRGSVLRPGGEPVGPGVAVAVAGRIGAVLVYASGRPVDLGELIGRDKVPEALYAGSPEMVDILRQRITPRGA